MSSPSRLRQFLPVVVSLAIIGFAGRVLYDTWHRVQIAEVVAHLQALPVAQLALGAGFVIVVFAALALYEAIIAGVVGGSVSPRRAAITALIAAPLGHAIGWGALSGGAVRYRLYTAAGMRPLDVGKMVLLAALPYAAGLGLLLGVSLVMRSHEAAGILNASEDVVRGTGLGFLALHAAYVGFVLRQRTPLALRRMGLALPTPSLTAVQYAIGIVEVCAGASVLYVLLPDVVDVSFVAFIGVYVLCILAGLASSVPAGLGVFEATLVSLLPHVPPNLLIGTVLAYRVLLEVVPLAIALALFASYEAWSRLPAQRRRAAALRARQDAGERGA